MTKNEATLSNLELPTKPEYCKNPFILKWWTAEYDSLIAKLIDQYRWGWYWEITSELLKIVPSATIETWKLEDPLCSQYAWYNVLMYFAAARAKKLGWTKERKHERKICPICERVFASEAFGIRTIKIFGCVDHLDFCPTCVSVALGPYSGIENLSRDQILEYLRDLANRLQRVPSQSTGETPEDISSMSYEERLELFKVLVRKPKLSCIKSLFGSWFEALLEAGVLEDGTRRSGRGVECIAKDGHICFSLGEKTIDDFLCNHSIPHEKEPLYPEGSFRADFSVNGVFIEYFGLKGNPEYDEKTRKKQQVCRKYGIKLISVYPSDLVSAKKLEKKLLGDLLPPENPIKRCDVVESY